MTRRSNQRGMALVMSCMMLAVLALMGSAMLVQSTTEHRVVRRYAALSSSFQLAEAGADHAMANIEAGDDGDVDEVELADGSYWAEVAPLSGSRYSITSHGLVGDIERSIEVVVLMGGLQPFQYGLFGETSVTLKKNSTTDSYASSEGDYDEDGAGEQGDLATNGIVAGSISIAKDTTIKGQLTVGPGLDDPENAVSLAKDVSISASPEVASAPEPMTLPAIDTGGMDCSSDLALPKNGTYTFTEAGSPYCFDSLTADKGSQIAVSGNVVVYADNVDFDKNLSVNVGGKPTQFLLNIYGTSDVVIDKEGTFVGAIYAPGLHVHLKKDVTLYGAVAAESIEVDKSLTLHYDEDLEDVSVQGSSELSVESWREL